MIEITPDQLERKIKLLTLSSLAFKYIGQNLPYSEIAEALKIDTSEVEKWVIDGELYFPPFIQAPFIFTGFGSHSCWSCLGKAITNDTEPSSYSVYLSDV